MKRVLVLAVSAFAAALLASSASGARGPAPQDPAPADKKAEPKAVEKGKEKGPAKEKAKDAGEKKAEVEAVPVPSAPADDENVFTNVIIVQEVEVARGVVAEAPRFDLGGVFRAVVRAIAPDAAPPHAVPAPVAMPAVAVPAGVVAVAPAALPDDDPTVQQWILQCRPYLKSEFAFVKATCGLDKAQRERIALAGEQALREAARKAARSQNMPQVLGGAQAESNNPRRAIRKGLAEAVKANLPPDKAGRFLEEVEARDAQHKRAAVVNLVAKLDHELYLSAEQRGKLQEALAKNWDGSWCESLEAMVAYGDQYFPMVPEEQVAPFLNGEQKKIWSTVQKVQYNAMSFWGGEDNGFDDPDLEAAMRAESGKGKK